LERRAVMGKFKKITNIIDAVKWNEFICKHVNEVIKNINKEYAKGKSKC